MLIVSCRLIWQDSNHHDDVDGFYRYYYLSFGDGIKASHCVDIGVRMRGRPIDNEWAQLGAISVHEGEVRRLKIQLPTVSLNLFYCFCH